MDKLIDPYLPNEIKTDVTILKQTVNTLDINKLNELKRDYSYFDLPIIESEIKDKILNAAELTSEQKLDYLFTEAYDKKNMFAHYEIAMAYKNGILLEQSDEKYIETLLEIVNSDVYHKNCAVAERKLEDIYIHQDYEMEQYIDISEWYTTSLLCGAYNELAVYYSTSTNIDELKKAEQYYFITEKLSLGHIDRKEIDTVRAKIEWLANNNSLSNEKNYVPYNIDYFGENLKNTIQVTHVALQNIKDSLIKDFSEVRWNLLSKEARSYLLTSYFSFIQLQILGEDLYQEIDFGGIINLSLKALEYELALRFQKKYLIYLQNAVRTPDNYCKINQIEFESLAIERRDLFYLNRKTKKVEFHSVDDYLRFTIGSFSFVLGLQEENYKRDGRKIDKTALSFIKTEIYDAEDEKIKNWLFDLQHDIDVLRQLRNKASHGGKILTIHEAKDCMDMMLYTKKIMIRLVEPSYNFQ